MYLLVFLAALSAAALPELSGRLLQSSSDDWARIPVDEPGCVLVNNVWNKAAAQGALRQQVFLEQVDGARVAGWRWSSPALLFPTVVSQPQMVCGDKPWDPPSQARADFPFRAGSRQLAVNFNASVRATGVYNMSFTLWAVSSLPASKAAISHEIMIWTAKNGQMPAGRPRGTVDIDGVAWDVWVEQRHGDDSGANANTWMYVAFVARRPVMSGPLDLDRFLAWLLREGLLTEAHSITSVELGNEVDQGAGIVELRDFSLRFSAPARAR